MKTALAVCSLFTLSACFAPEPARVPRNIAPVESPRTSIEEQARAAARASEPRSEHRVLETLVGTWNTSVVSVAGDGTESDPRSGVAAIEWVLGGRYLKWDATLDLGTEVHATTGFLGYDVNQGEYQLLMISDLATGMGVAHGRGDVGDAGLKFVLDVTEPGTGAVRRAVSTMRATSHDQFVLEQLGQDGAGNERVVRRTHYRRATPRVTK